MGSRLSVAAVTVAALCGVVGAGNVAAAWCKGGVSVAAARAHIGDLVRVKGRITRVYYARGSSGSPTFIDLAYRYPSSRRLTLVIWGENRSNFPRTPEQMFRRGTLICAEGRVTSYGGAAQIEVSLWDASARLISF